MSAHGPKEALFDLRSNSKVGLGPFPRTGGALRARTMKVIRDRGRSQGRGPLDGRTRFARRDVAAPRPRPWRHGRVGPTLSAVTHIAEKCCRSAASDGAADSPRDVRTHPDAEPMPAVVRTYGRRRRDRKASAKAAFFHGANGVPAARVWRGGVRSGRPESLRPSRPRPRDAARHVPCGARRAIIRPLSARADQLRTCRIWGTHVEKACRGSRGRDHSLRRRHRTGRQGRHRQRVQSDGRGWPELDYLLRIRGERQLRAEQDHRRSAGGDDDLELHASDRSDAAGVARHRRHDAADHPGRAGRRSREPSIRTSRRPTRHGRNSSKSG